VPAKAGYWQLSDLLLRLIMQALQQGGQPSCEVP